MIGLIAFVVMQVVPAPLEQARALVSEGRTADAVTVLQVAIRAAPDDAGAHNMLGALLNRQGRYPEALIHADQAARLAPDNARYRYNRGIVRAERGQVTEALDDFDFAIDAMPDQAPMHLERGAALLALSRNAEARAAWRHARELDPALVWTDWYEGLHDFIDGNLELAIGKLARVAAAEPEFPAAPAWLALAHLRAGSTYAPPQVTDPWATALLDYQTGRRSFEALLAEARSDRTTGDERRVGEAWLHHGIRLAADGKPVEARAALVQATSVRAPRHAWKLLAERALSWVG